MTLPLALYRLASRALVPLLARRMDARPDDSRLPRETRAERLGHASRPRPEGRVLWLHGASVGESRSILPVIDALRREDPAARYLVTTGTPTAARMLASTLPEGCTLQFAPLDAPRAIRRFLDHWHPDRLVLAESEIWPNWIAACRARGIPVTLIGARLSAGSLRNWARFPRSAREVWSGLSLVSAQGDAQARALAALGAPAAPGPDLKAAALPLTVPAELDTLRTHLADRPVWAAVSTHPGEEEIVLAAHDAVRQRHPDALLLLVPRHPDRGDALAARATMVRRADLPGPGDAVWLCDTMGETGLWFFLSQVVFLGGSLVPVGGHNPWEPARLGRGPLHGPHVGNAAHAYADLDAAGGALEVTETTLGDTVADLLADPGARARLDTTARRVAEDAARDLGTLARAILALEPDR